MKKTKLLLPLVTLITLSQVAHALELPVVSKYNEAESVEVWRRTKTDQVPAALMSRESISNPSSSYSKLFPKTFLQEEMFVVCYQDCNSNDIFHLNQEGEIVDQDKSDWNVIEQSNVYFWLNRYFEFLESHLNFKPNKHLRVMTNRDYRKGDAPLTNNAFFMPSDTTLSFLPANKNLLFKLMAGKVNRSGFDPSVIAHEASHYFFQHLFPISVNDEITGLNEGFADYIANIFLDNPKVGLIMLQGKAIRDASNIIDSAKKMKTYEPGLEVHKLGERVAYALWESRKLTQNKEEFDRLVIDAVLDISKNPYSAVHDFKEKMLERMSTLMDSNALVTANKIWESTFPGEASKIASTNFLTNKAPSKFYMGYRMSTKIPEAMAKANNVEPIRQKTFTLIKSEKISPTQVAILAAKETDTVTTPYWLVMDLTRGNALGVFSIDGKLITEEKELEEALPVASEGISSLAFVTSFSESLANFGQLADGKGPLTVGLKVKGITTKDVSVTFNGQQYNGRETEMAVKRKMLVGALLGIPSVDKITLITVPEKLKGLPELKDQTIIGYRFTLPDGVESETVLSKYFNQN